MYLIGKSLQAFVDEPNKPRRDLDVNSDDNTINVPELGDIKICVKSILLAERPGLQERFYNVQSASS